MLSLRARIFINLLNRSKKKQIKDGRDTIFTLDTSIETFRDSVSKSSKMFGRLSKDIMRKEEEHDGVKCEWLYKSMNPKEKVILYFHGGGYVSGAYEYHRTHVAKWVNTMGINALVFNYRLAPEHPYPAALNDSVKVYESLLEQGYEAHNIVLAGDSAGAGLCLCTLNALKDKNIPLPLCAIAISPWTDLACKGDAYEKNRYTCLSPQDSWTVFSHHYRSGADPENPWISPLYGNLDGLPPIYVTVGSTEIFLDDAIAYTSKVNKAGGEAVLEIGEGLFHCYPMCGKLFPEAQDSLKKIATFIKTCNEQ